MMSRDWMILLQEQTQLSEVIKTNEATKQFGLSLTKQDAELILAERKHTLAEQKRIEFGESITPKIIYEFCDSDFIRQSNYAETIIRLQEIFYLYKNEMLDEITDDELLHLMKELFEHICFGDTDYLESTCLAGFAEAIRAGYDGYQGSDGYGEYTKFDIVKRWDHALYLEALKELCWR